MKNKCIIVIGGGPAGMMAAIQAAGQNARVVLIEKNASLGRKLLYTGKGRCNLTNACCLDDFMARLSKGAPFLRDAFKVFFNTELMAFFESRGCPLKVERQNRVFPRSDKASSVLRVLEKELKRKNVQVIFSTEVQDLFISDGKIAGVFCKDQTKMLADRVIVTTGGLSFPKTGATGDGLKMAQHSQHKIVSPRPALVALEVAAPFIKSCEGIALKNISISFTAGKKKIVSGIGEMIFTATGISGPLVLTMSGQVVDWLSDQKQVLCSIDLKPGLSVEQCVRRLSREFKAAPKALIKTVVQGMLPKRLVEVLLEHAGINSRKTVSSFQSKECLCLAQALKSFSFYIAASKFFADAMVTQGGVSLKDMNPRTMESKKIKGLYFAGEVIDIHADTGGFNLQVAFSTGFLAGQSAAFSDEESL